MKIYAFIFVRAGSKGLPGKNLMEIGGISLLGRAIRCAKEVPEIHKVIVSTDDPQLADEARRHGAEAPFLRPAELATDESPEWASWQHAVQFLQDRGETFDLFVSVPATAPLRQPVDIQNAIRTFQTCDCDIVLSITDAQRSPYFSIVAEQPDGFIQTAIAPPAQVYRRQDAPLVYDVTPVAYVTTPAHIKSAFGYYDGRVKGNYVPLERTVDIDTILDFKLAQVMYTHMEAQQKIGS